MQYCNQYNDRNWGIFFLEAIKWVTDFHKVLREWERPLFQAWNEGNERLASEKRFLDFVNFVCPQNILYNNAPIPYNEDVFMLSFSNTYHE